jgi:adenylyltransferase/sulfurtransferase
MSRYAQQVLLNELGISGQKTLENTSVLVIGAGGLGTVVATYLAGMGFGKIGICDGDVVGESNLHRQYFYAPNDIGLFKAERLSEILSIQNPHIELNAFVQNIQEDNANELISNYSIICDCTDNAKSRILINRFCENHHKTLVHGAVSEWQGYVTVFHHKKQFSLDNLFEMENFLKSESCAIGGINPTVCGIVGSYMANECLKISLNLDSVLDGKLMYVNTLNNVFRVFNLKREVSEFQCFKTLK